MRLASRLAALVPLLLAAPASAISVSFTKIADAGMLGPAWQPGSVAFNPPALDDGVVAFSVTGFSPGVFTSSGGALTTLLDGNTLVPGSTTAFAWTSDVSLSNGHVAFMGNDANFFRAIYSTLGGSLAPIASDGMPAPGGGSSLQILAPAPSIDGENVAFLALDTTFGHGYFTNVAGVLELSAGENTPVPGAGSGILLLDGPPALDGSSVAFYGRTATADGIYVADAGNIRLVADTNTPVPGGSEPFVFFGGALAHDDGNVVFDAFTTDNELYAEIDGSLVHISSEYVYSASISGDRVAWLASSDSVGQPDSYLGLYVLYDGQREKVIEVSDGLDGRALSHFAVGPEGLDGDQLAFTAHFEDGTSGVYLAHIPEPGTALLLGAGLAALAARRGRRR